MMSPSDQKYIKDISTAGIVVVSIYIAAQMLSDIASLKIGLIAGFSIDAGTFIYPITFTLRDLVHKRLGKQAARTVIIVAAGINLFMALFLQFAASFRKIRPGVRVTNLLQFLARYGESSWPALLPK